jgi:hypothetical protein
LLDPELSDLGGELGWRLPAKCTVCFLAITFVSPVLKERLRFEETIELLAVQELVTQTGVERFNPTKLPRLIGVHKKRCRTVEATPGVERVRDELGPVVHVQVERRAAFAGELMQLTTSSGVMERPTSMVRHSRVNSSMMMSITVRRSLVWSN